MATNTAPRSPDKLFLALFALAIIVVGGLWFSIQGIIAPSKETATELLRTPAPETLNALYSARTESGDVAEFFDKTTNHKFSVAIAPREEPTAPTPQQLLDAVIEFQASRAINPQFAPLTVKFSQALFTGRRAYDVTEGTITVDGVTYPVLRFLTNKGANHAITVFSRPNEQVVILALKKNGPVDTAALERFMAQVRPSTTASAPPTP
jgi:hypothetical protein